MVTRVRRSPLPLALQLVWRVCSLAVEWALAMFILAELQDVVRVEPWKFAQDMNEVVTETLNNKLANKVGWRATHRAVSHISPLSVPLVLAHSPFPSFASPLFH